MLSEFKIIPILGRKTDVPMDDMSLFQYIGDDGNVALTHDVGGTDFSLSRKRNACVKSYGYSEWSNSANAQATKCLGLFMLYDGTHRNYLYFDNGKVYYYDSSLDPQDISPAGVTLANDNVDIYSLIQCGMFVVIADRAEHTPYVWSHNDAACVKLITAGTEFKFRYLQYFSRRIIGLYSDQTNGDIDIRWSNALPDPGTDCEFAAANQLYCPNDDSITGASLLGSERCFVFCENSINELVYYQDYSSPFRIYTVVTNEGTTSHHSIINLGDRLLFFNKNYGFCEYSGGNSIKPISNDIESDLQGINADYYDLIVGTSIPLTRQAVWTVPMGGDTTPDTLVFYNADTGQWTFEDKAMRYVASWRMYDNYTWNDFISALGGDGDTATDSSGNNNTGTLEGTMTDSDWITGKSGSMIDFDGTDDRVDVGTGGSTDLASVGNGSFWVSLWMKSGDSIKTSGRLVSKQQSVAINFMLMSYAAQDRLAFAISESTGTRSVSDYFDTTFNPFDEGFHHIVWVVDLDNYESYIYMDGTKGSREVDLSYLASTNCSNTGRLSFGANDDGTYPYYGGLDEIRIYSGVPTQAEVSSLYNSPDGAGSDAPDDGNLLGYWAFNDRPAIWSDAGTHTWAYYASRRQRLVFGNTDGKLYYHEGESLADENIDGYRVEPALKFGNIRTGLQEIWFDLVEVNNFSIDISYRGGDTLGELNNEDWESLGSISCDSPDYPVLRDFHKHNLYHQIKWGTDAANEKFSINGIIFKFSTEGTY